MFKYKSYCKIKSNRQIVRNHLEKMLKVSVALVVLLGFTCAYNFEDPIYNQYLSQDFEDLALPTSIQNYRVRRDDTSEKCHHKHHFFCCAQDELMGLHEKFHDLKKECFKEVTGNEYGGPPFTCEELEKRKKDMICVGECFGKKKGILDDEGNIKEEALKEKIKEHFTGLEWFQPKLDDAVTKCIGEAKEAAAKHDTSDKTACNPSDMKFGYCLFKEIQMNCPADKIDDQAKCDAFRENLKKHDFPPPH